jgi:MoxR-like ATPase
MNKYILSGALERAVDIALHLNRPLLLCGEPGTGKTALAKHLALLYSATGLPGYAGFHPVPLVFNTKTTSTATDLFYSYDALTRLRDAYSKNEKPVGHYIELRALGKAIAFQHGLKSEKLESIKSVRDFVDKKSVIPENPTSTVVLMDEIDKAPRDFPNDILNEIEKMEFEIKELNAYVPPAESNAKTLVIMTSNNEKNLPDAFLRRCIFHYIEFPEPGQLQEIVKLHFEEVKTNGQVMGIIETFNKLRALPLIKRPATAEFIDWLKLLQQKNLLKDAQEPYKKLPAGIAAELNDTLCVLCKNANDLNMVKEEIKNW